MLFLLIEIYCETIKPKNLTLYNLTTKLVYFILLLGADKKENYYVMTKYENFKYAI